MTNNESEPAQTPKHGPQVFERHELEDFTNERDFFLAASERLSNAAEAAKDYAEGGVAEQIEQLVYACEGLAELVEFQGADSEQFLSPRQREELYGYLLTTHETDTRDVRDARLQAQILVTQSLLLKRTGASK